MLHYYDSDKIDLIGLVDYLKSNNEAANFIETDESISCSYKEHRVTIRHEDGDVLLWADSEIFSELEKILKPEPKPL